MKILSLKRLFALILCFISIEVVAQNGFYVNRGTSVSFHFNSITKIQNGITYNNFAQFYAYNDGTHVNGPNWRLTVRGNATFANGLPLEVVEIRADIAPADGTSAGWIYLDNGLAAVDLITNGNGIPATPMTIDISYRVGDLTNPNQMTGYPSDYYTVDLIFEIVFF